MRMVRAASGASLVARRLATVKPLMMLLYLRATELTAAPGACVRAPASLLSVLLLHSGDVVESVGPSASSFRN